MSKKSLPLTLYQTLEKHAQESDISDDEELKDILDKLASLNKKVEAFKQRAREMRVEKAPNVFLLKSRNPNNTL
ncbi:hypothetical protein GPAL_1574 [Glaciecola pallidula DSM 14239 = ACAM 615]|jgi:hypothetical protein|uniref:Uncharacterized protein n=1 Tax=Brumicola pallidula DSM 14239 = ACAM 615 TaxID=1121922 RepID=K6ZHR7_9ALTE|nr:hypothetical protein GPAL_1574 [Glaciecola pallidula DSM 14239 = ACAM 615]